MKYLAAIIFLLIAIIFDRKLIEGFNTRNNKKVLNCCKETKINQYRLAPRNSKRHWNTNIIRESDFNMPKPLNNKVQCKNDCLEGFFNRPFIWIYIDIEVDSRFWKSFYSRRQNQTIPKYIHLAIESIKVKNKENANIQLISDDNIIGFVSYIPFDWCDSRISKQAKKDYLKYYLLYNYGGIWVPYTTIAFKNFSEIFDKLRDFELITFGCSNKEILCNTESNVNDSLIASNKHTKIVKQLLEKTTNEIKNLLNNYSFSNKTNSILNSTIKLYKDRNYVYNFSNEYDGSRDYNNKLINSENLISKNYTLFKNPNKVIFICLDRDHIKKHIKYNWLERLSVKQLLDSNMWISKLYRFVFRKKQQHFFYENINNNKLIKHHFNIFPKNKADMYSTFKNMNISQENPYSLVSKESYRNS